MIGSLRSLGLTIKEIEQLAGAYLDRPDEPMGPRLAALLDRAERRVEERMRQLEEVLERIRAFRAQRRDALAGHAEHELTGGDPRKRT
jgi:DNA-binding transcriptional MerR regulator